MEFCTVCTLEWVAALAVLIYAIYAYGTWTFNTFREREMPYLEPTFFVGNLGKFVRGKISLVDNSLEFYNKFKGHRAFGTFNFRKPAVYIMDPEIIKMVTVKDFEYFNDRVEIINEHDDLIGKILFNLYGSRWKNMRNILTPAFTSSKMKSMFELVVKCGEQLADYLEEKCKGEKDGSLPLEMRDLFTRYANDVIATSAYGIHCDSLKQPTNEFYMMGKEAVDFGGIRALIFMLFFHLPRLARLIGAKATSPKVSNFFISIVTNTMRIREKENIFRPDMIQLLMQAKKGTLREEGEDKGTTEDDRREVKTLSGAYLTDEDIAAQAFQFFVAGFDTSSTHLSFLAYELALHPEIQERVRQEIDEVLAQHKGRLTYDGVQKMRYLDNVMSETLRLWPPIAEVNRTCVKDYTVPATKEHPKIIIEKGDIIMISAIGLQRDPDYFPEPERFDPERFSDENKANVKPFTYLPFGMGPRNCIGSRFATMETKIAIACILSRFTINVTSKTPIPIRLCKGTFNTSAEGGFWLNIKPRA